MRYHRASLFACLICIALFITGCEAIPVSQHPLSDETNSEVDPALLGLWDMIDLTHELEPPAAAAKAETAEEKEDDAAKDDAAKDEPTPAEKPTPDPDAERPPRFGIGRLAGKEKSLEMVSMHLTDDHIEIKRTPLHATKVGKLPMISVRANPEETESYFILLRYEVVNENRILVYFLNREAIAKAIQRGELKGVVRKAAPKDPNDPNSEERKEQIRITASPEELRGYLTRHEKTAFEPKAVWRMQRAAGN